MPAAWPSYPPAPRSWMQEARSFQKKWEKSGSGALIDGVQQLDDGAAELNDGMIRFDRDGIQKLVDAFGGDVEDLLDKMNDMLDASRAYKNFSGISDDMDGEVKFVFVTEE